MKLDEVEANFFLFVLVLYTPAKQRSKMQFFWQVLNFRLRVGDFGGGFANRGFREARPRPK